MDTEDPGLEPLNALMLDLRQEAFKYLGQGSRVAEIVIAMLDASAAHLPAASASRAAMVRLPRALGNPREVGADPGESIKNALIHTAAEKVEQQPAASVEPVAYLVRNVGGKRGAGTLVRACDIGSYQRATLEREPLYSAQPAPALVPPGWMLVPVEPTEAMCKAAVIYANGNGVYRNVAAEALKIEEAIYGEAYAAMLAAAPTAQPTRAEGG